MGIQNLRQAEHDNKLKLFISIVKITILAVIVVGIPLYLFFFQRDFLSEFKNIDDIVSFLDKYKWQAAFVYIGFQVLQIVISIIPGQVFQMAAGYLFSFWPALLYAMTGAIIGTMISFGLAKVLGRDFLHILFGKEKMTYYIERLNSKKAYTIVFLIYLIPGIPKDMVSYAAGVSEMRFKAFIILSALGRMPGMIGCLLMGIMLDKKNYTGLIIIGAIAIVAFILCIVYRKKIHLILDKFYEKLTK